MKEKLNKKQIIIIAVAAAIVVAAVVCIFAFGNGGSNSKVPKTTEEIMERAVEEFEAMESFQLDNKMVMTMENQGETMTMDVLLTSFYKKDDAIKKAISTISIEGLGAYSTNYFAEKSGDGYILYSNMEGGEEWTKTTVATEEELPMGNPQAEVLRFLKGVNNYERVGSEKISDINTVKYQCVSTPKDMKQTLEASGILEQAGNDGLSEDELESIYEQMEEMKFVVWIGKEDYLPYKVEMDLGNFITTMSNFADIDESQKQSLEMVKGLTMTYTITNYNQLGDTALPEGIEGATEA